MRISINVVVLPQKATKKDTLFSRDGFYQIINLTLPQQRQGKERNLLIDSFIHDVQKDVSIGTHFFGYQAGHGCLLAREKTFLLYIFVLPLFL